MEQDCNNFDEFVHKLVEYHLQYGNSIHILRHRTHNSGGYARSGVPLIVPTKGSYWSFCSPPRNQNTGRRYSLSSPWREFAKQIEEKMYHRSFGQLPPNQNTARQYSPRSPGRKIVKQIDKKMSYWSFGPLPPNQKIFFNQLYFHQ